MASEDDRERRFTELYDRYSGHVLAYAARRTPDRADAADVLSDTFLVAWRRIDDVPATDDALPWLYGVARRTLANHRRGAARRTRLTERVRSQVDAVVEGAVPGVDGPEKAAVSRALTSLSPGDQELLLLVGWEGLDRESIAQMLEVSGATVRVRLHRARGRFKRALAAQGVQRPDPRGHEADGWASALLDPEVTR